MSEPIPIRSIEDVNLDEHAVIEASAGTGKTYTIEHLAVELVRRKGLRLDQILIVTYTEKATGELRQRVREQLEKALRDDPENPLLRQAVDTFDTAAIHTIHGFCQRMLRQYAFENGEPFEHELVDDQPVYHEVMLDLLRRVWPGRYGDGLAELLEVAGFAGKEDDWVSNLIGLCKLYRPQCGDRLLPEAGTVDMVRARERLRETLARVAAIAGEGLAAWYDTLKISAGSRAPRIEKVLAPTLELAARHESATLGDWAELVDGCRRYGGFKSNGFPVLVQGFEKLTPDPRMQPFGELVMLLDELQRELDPGWLSAAFRAEAARELLEGVQLHKAQHGLMSFEDMLCQVDAALDPRHNSRAEGFRQALRNRYQYAIVDEFQDTDPLQWRIFRAIFTGSETHRLMLIGDPKQAIYGFRGADLNTYLRATEELVESWGAVRYSLPVNFRSMPELLDDFNGLFGTESWFPEGDGVVYRPVEAPPEELRRTRIERDTSGRRRLNLLLADGGQNLPQVAERLYEAIAGEIEWLLGGRLTIVSGGKPARPLGPGDICVLVRKGKEANQLQRVLAVRGIPVSFYKQAGLYQTDQAIQLIHLLQGIAEPGDPMAVRRALLSSFFAVELETLAQHDEVGLDDPRHRKLYEWHRLAASRQWARLFQAILEETGVLLREQAQPDGERRLANYRHLTQELYLLAVRDKLDLLDLVNGLRHRRAGSVAVDQGDDLQRLETEQPKVRVMTIHSSKGLEFPVVFVAGGLGNSQGDGHYRFHDGESMVYDLARDEANKARSDAEALAEERRLYYVALTRASHQLYLPWLEPPGKGPMSTLVGMALHTRDLPATRVVEPVVGGEAAEPAAPAGVPATVGIPRPLLPQVDPSIRDRRIRVASFSSLHQYESGDHERPLDAFSVLADQPMKEDDEPQGAPRGTPADDPLPAGTATGSMLHDLLEHADWAAVDVASSDELLAAGHPVGQLIDRLLATYGVGERAADTEAGACRRRVAEVVHRTLTTPLPPLGLRLVELARQDRLHELEFHFSLPVEPQEALPELKAMPDGFIHGYIDLLFRWQGRFYLLDWKSNFLESGYGQESLGRCMREADYHLQYKLYALAVRRWLRERKEPLAGAFYLFLRGIDAASPGDGVFWAGF